VDNLLDGRQISAEINGETKQKVSELQEKGIQPRLVFVRVGEDPASRVYVGMKEKTANKVGITSKTIVLAEDTDQQTLLALVQDLNRDQNTHGILVQAPLPKQISETVIYQSVLPSKDVDGFHPENVGKLMLGEVTGFIPCTPAGVHELLRRSGKTISGSHAVILGRGNIVGKPMAALLIQKAQDANCTVTVCHSRTPNISEICQTADILIAAMGMPEFVKADMVKPGAIVIDVGVNRISDPNSKTGSRLVGDVVFKEVQKVAGKITPNPGGVGPMTIAMLMRNTAAAAAQSTSS
jgi:methylenetetrahydrofolate dehydrogenase (NADP+) / methenyltetrahydrofolate cyclohydrolase